MSIFDWLSSVCHVCWSECCFHREPCIYSSMSAHFQSKDIIVNIYKNRSFALNKRIWRLMRLFTSPFLGGMLDIKIVALGHLPEIATTYSTYSMYFPSNSSWELTWKSVDPTCNTTACMPFSFSGSTSQSLLWAPLISKPPTITLDTSIVRSASLGMLTYRQCDVPNRVTFILSGQ